MLRWEWIALAYFSYLAVVASVFPRFARARPAALAAAACGWAFLAAAAQGDATARVILLANTLIPVPVLLVGYWLSGRFFVAPMLDVERWLLRVDDVLLERPGILHWYRAAPRSVREFFELAYVLVYAVVPAGAVALALGGQAEAIGRFWSVVLLAEFASYGMLPWVQTRPPRLLAQPASVPERVTPLRRLNLAILGRGSIQANTLPSGHAAGAVAVALALAEPMPLAGLGFLLLSACITVATILGRYHFVVDSVLGVLVAFAAWGLALLAG